MLKINPRAEQANGFEKGEDVLTTGDVIVVPKGTRVFSKVISKETLSGWEDQEFTTPTDREYVVVAIQDFVECKLLPKDGSFPVHAKRFRLDKSENFRRVRRMEVPASLGSPPAMRPKGPRRGPRGPYQIREA